MSVLIKIGNADLGKILDCGVRVEEMWQSTAMPFQCRMTRREGRQTIVRGVPLLEYKPILISTLRRFSGCGEARVGSVFYRDLRNRVAITQDDLAIQQSGLERWWNSMQWQRLKLRHAGILKSHSPHALWELA